MRAERGGFTRAQPLPAGSRAVCAACARHRWPGRLSSASAHSNPCLVMRFLGIDLGTGSLKLAIVDGDGRVRASSGAAYAVATPQPGWAEIDVAAWWRALVDAATAARAGTRAGARDRLFGADARRRADRRVGKRAAARAAMARRARDRARRAVARVAESGVARHGGAAARVARRARAGHAARRALGAAAEGLAARGVGRRHRERPVRCLRDRARRPGRRLGRRSDRLARFAAHAVRDATRAGCAVRRAIGRCGAHARPARRDRTRNGRGRHAVRGARQRPRARRRRAAHDGHGRADRRADRAGRGAARGPAPVSCGGRHALLHDGRDAERRDRARVQSDAGRTHRRAFRSGGGWAARLRLSRRYIQRFHSVRRGDSCTAPPR